MRMVLVYMIMVLLAFRTDAQQTRNEPSRPIDVAKELAAKAMQRWPDSDDRQPSRRKLEDWKCSVAMMRLWYSTGDARYYTYVKDKVDRFLNNTENMAGRNSGGYGLVERIHSGRLLLQLYDVTEKPGYYQAATILRQKFGRESKVSNREVAAMAVVNSYMEYPFLAQYAALFHVDSVFADIAHEFRVFEPFMWDRQTGLLRRGAMGGGDGMALVDALDYFPVGDPAREVLMGILQRYAVAASKTQDAATGLWADAPNDLVPAAYPETAVSARFVYILARGVLKGYLPALYRGAAEKGWEAIRSRFATDKDAEGIADVMLAAVEMDELYSAYGQGGKTVLLDYYFNNERRKDITGVQVRYHYTWEDRANSGFSLLGHLFRQYGAQTDSLPVAPTPDNLAKASVYIIVDPDDDREVPDPHYLMPPEIGVIDDWVKAGGVLVLMSNDSANAEFEHFNVLAGTFGIHFNFDDYHKVTGSQYEMGAFDLPPNDAIFQTARRIYIKEMSTLRLIPPANAHFTDKGHVIMAVARVGRGTVFAIGDPWFYNEYTDGRKLPPVYENYNAARDLVRWLLLQARQPTASFH